MPHLEFTNMIDAIKDIALPIILGVLGWLGNAYRNKQKRESDILDNVQRIIDMQNGHITRCETSLDEREKAYKEMCRKNDRKREAIKRAYKCKMPSEDCPVLIYDAQTHEQENSKCDNCELFKQAHHD